MTYYRSRSSLGDGVSWISQLDRTSRGAVNFRTSSYTKLRSGPVYFLALATDFDGTIARDGVVKQETIDALRLLKESGRRLILVTGRELPDLIASFPELVLFDSVVAENGALLY